jgi:hypothetical protein
MDRADAPENGTVQKLAGLHCDTCSAVPSRSENARTEQVLRGARNVVNPTSPDESGCSKTGGYYLVEDRPPLFADQGEPRVMPRL